MSHRARPIVLVAVLASLVAACGSRVVPLPQAAGVGGQPVGGVPLPGQTTGPGVNPTGSALPGVGSSTAPGNPIKPILPNCRGGATDTGVTASTIKLGLVASKEGPLPGQFNAAIEAADAYFRGLNDAGGICGRKIQLLIRNDNGNGSTNLQVAQKLATEDKIFAFVGGTSAPDDSGIAKTSKKYKIPDIGFPLTWERTENPYTYGVPGQLQRRTIGEGAAGSTYLNKTLGIKQVALFWLRESEVSVLNAYAFETTMVKMSGGAIKICFEQPTGVLDANYTNYVVSMAGSCDPDDGPIAVYTTMENNANLKLAKAMKEQQFKPAAYVPTFTSYHKAFVCAKPTPTGCAEIERSTEGTYIALPQVPFERLERPQNEWTPGSYEAKRYFDTLYRYYPRPSPPGSFGGPGWGMAGLFTEAAAKCGAGLTRTCLFNALDTMGPFTANGFLTPTKPSVHAIYTADLIVQVRNGKFVELRPTDRSGPPGGPDFWDKSVLYNWQQWFCDNQSKFPDAETKKELISEC